MPLAHKQQPVRLDRQDLDSQRHVTGFSQGHRQERLEVASRDRAGTGIVLPDDWPVSGQATLSHRPCMLGKL